MPVFAVDTQAVTDTATRTRTRISTIQTEVDAMNADIATLQASWTGGASASMASCSAHTIESAASLVLDGAEIACTWSSYTSILRLLDLSGRIPVSETE